jgi:hypothetical protein
MFYGDQKYEALDYEGLLQLFFLKIKEMTKLEFLSQFVPGEVWPRSNPD